MENYFQEQDISNLEVLHSEHREKCGIFHLSCIKRYSAIGPNRDTQLRHTPLTIPVYHHMYFEHVQFEYGAIQINFFISSSAEIGWLCAGHRWAVAHNNLVNDYTTHSGYSVLTQQRA